MTSVSAKPMLNARTMAVRRELLQLKADQQDREGGRTGQQATRQAKQDDLPRRHPTIGEAPFQLGGVLTGVSVVVPV